MGDALPRLNEVGVAAARSAIDDGDDEAVMAAIPEGMASDVALLGTSDAVLEGAEAWEAARKKGQGSRSEFR